MSSCHCFSKKKHQARARRTEPYKKVNAYTQTPSFEQILTLILFIAQLAGHSLFIVTTLKSINNVVLWSMLGFHYSLLLVIFYDYIYITTKDPVDRIIVNEQLAAKYSSLDVKMCLICNCQVHKNSHHCMKCNRCTEQFDHHCRFLNNCIGSRNYQAFFRLLLVYTFYNMNLIGMAIWTALANFQDPSISFIGHNVWGIVGVGGLTLLIEIAVVSLLGFHFYISCYEHMTTFEHNYKPKEQDEVMENIKINLWGAPNSGERLRRHQGKQILQRNP